MTLLDDEVLGALLHELGDSYAVPASGIADTLRRVRRGDEERTDPGPTARGESGSDGPAPRPVRAMIRSHRMLSAAAAVIVLLALAGGAAVLGSTSHAPKTAIALKPLNRALPPSTRHAPGTSGSTAAKSSVSTAAPGTRFSTAGPALGAPASANAPVTSSSPSLPAGAVGQPARIEQTGSLDLTVPRAALSSTVTRLTTLASTYDGFVANSQTQSIGSAGGTAGATVTLQVPVADFSALLTQAKSLGTTTALTTKATDVTGQYVDLQAQITALEASRQQYLTIMAKATSIGDVLAVQAQLDTLQSQIQQLQGQLGVLQSETDYSTLTVSLSVAGRHPHRAPSPTVSGVAKAWHDSLHGFAVGVDGVIRLAGPVLFALLCLAALVLGGRLTWRRLQRRSL